MSDIQAKQQFLRVEILEENIDPQDFLAFLVSVNPKKGDDLELWKIQQLQQVVKAFKRSKNIPIKVQQKKQLTLNQPYTSKLSNTNDDNQYAQSIKCLVKQPNKICTYFDFKIKLTKFQTIQGGIFQRSYIVYTIEIPKLNSKVNRRYSDFVWFRETLALLYPGYPIPPLKKKGKFARYEEKYLLKKMLILQKFLDTLVAIPQIFSQSLFQKFLMIKDAKQFEKLKSQYNKLQKLPLAKIMTLSGSINIGTDKNLSNKVIKYQQYLKQTQPEIKKIYKNFKGIATCFQQANDIFLSVSKGCKYLQAKQQSIRTQLGLPSIMGQNPLSVLQNLTQLYGAQLKEQAQSFRRDIYSLMKYQSLYRLNILQSMDQLAQAQEEYIAAKTSLLKKKEKLYADGRIDKWGVDARNFVKPSSKDDAIKLMLPKETREVDILRQNYALKNYQIYEECFRHTKDINRMLSNYIRQFMEMQVTNAARTAEIFTQISQRTQQIEKLYVNPIQV